MKKFLSIALLFVLISRLAGAIPDPYLMLQGKQMIPQGTPWIKDNAYQYFGTDKDASLRYDSAMDRLFVNDTDVFLEEDATFGQTVNFAVNATTTISTTLTASSTKTVYGVDASGGTVTLTLPDPTAVTGRMYLIATAKDMGSNNIIVADTGSGKIGGESGADTLTSTDAAAALAVISNGTHYLVISKTGSWT